MLLSYVMLSFSSLFRRLQKNKLRDRQPREFEEADIEGKKHHDVGKKFVVVTNGKKMWLCVVINGKKYPLCVVRNGKK